MKRELGERTREGLQSRLRTSNAVLQKNIKTLTINGLTAEKAVHHV
jgi:hypothetical protein